MPCYYYIIVLLNILNIIWNVVVSILLCGLERSKIVDERAKIIFPQMYCEQMYYRNMLDGKTNPHGIIHLILYFPLPLFFLSPYIHVMTVSRTVNFQKILWKCFLYIICTVICFTASNLQSHYSVLFPVFMGFT